MIKAELAQQQSTQQEQHSNRTGSHLVVLHMGSVTVGELRAGMQQQGSLAQQTWGTLESCWHVCVGNSYLKTAEKPAH
jgi:hypothetical protein